MSKNDGGLTPRGRLRKALKFLDAIETWGDRTGRLPDYVEAWLHLAGGLVAVTIDDLPKKHVQQTRERRVT